MAFSTIPSSPRQLLIFFILCARKNDWLHKFVWLQKFIRWITRTERDKLLIRLQPRNALMYVGQFTVRIIFAPNAAEATKLIKV